ncbi:hypothetical protein DNK56_26470 [Streptomyces sp. AC1-42W]|nr:MULTISPECIES: hypothetical protein [unclassified Streptomyces]PZT78055.1 hypothetical protein DNK56_26470 [Streptomyces sp. AC1-42W]PZT79228.1 hypothetical protein DNK55_06210 [Streptomyces sp. AC1-42T]
MRSPAVRRNGQWWLVSEAGAVRTDDPVFASALDALATASAAADRAVAGLRARTDALPRPVDRR